MHGRGLWLAAALAGCFAMLGCEHGARGTDGGASARDAAASDPLPFIRGKMRQGPASGHPGMLRIVDWNIAVARDSSLMEIGMTLQALDADVITLQEVDFHAQRTQRADEPALLADALGYNYVFAAAIPWDGGYYGIAMLSRVPFTSVERIHLSNADATEDRTAIEARLCPGRACIRAVNHHADLVPLAAQLSTNEVLEHIAAQAGTRVALLADLNQIPSDAGPQACLGAGLVDLGAQFGAAPTSGDRRIDYAFLDAALAACARQFAVMDAAGESDHRLLVLDLDEACVEAAH
jgi:endonuclease/exonuclease/phosphatase family metal-dependent hydrolase